MFERELIDALFVRRWSIVRTLMPQSIAEHTFLVAHYANDIATYLGLEPEVHLAVLQYSLHHDSKDEIFTGDLPGPNKRGLLDAIGPDAKAKWDAKLREWANRTFSNLEERMGGSLSPNDVYTVLLIVKAADWMESATRMATETQMGNKCAERHIIPNMNGAIETVATLVEHLGLGCSVEIENNLRMRIGNAVFAAQHGQSVGPWITKEDDSRTYHDPCVDSTSEGQESPYSMGGLR